MDSWEYKFISHEDPPWPGTRPTSPSWEEKLNAAGAEGWEAVGAPSSTAILMKRRRT